MEIPKNHQTIMPYLMLKNARGFGAFVHKVFDGQLTLEKFREDGQTMMHSEVTVGGSTIMFADANEDWPAQTANLFVYVPDADAAYHRATNQGATTVMELSDQDYGRTCGVKDPFGNTWWITAPVE